MKKPNRWIYIILALFMGGVGIHKIYEKMPFKFIVYLILCWTWIPCIIAFFEAVNAIFSDKFEG